MSDKVEIASDADEERAVHVAENYSSCYSAVVFSELLGEAQWGYIRKVVPSVEGCVDFMRVLFNKAVQQAHADGSPVHIHNATNALAQVDRPRFKDYLAAKMGMM